MRLLGKLLLFLVSTFAVLAVAETLLRIEASRSNSLDISESDASVRFSPFVSDSFMGYALRPNWRGLHVHTDFRVTVETNSLGLRGPELDTKTAKRGPRILVLGDSLAFGFGVESEEAFPRLISRMLEEEEITVVNAAVPGYSFDHHLVFLRNRLDEFAPDLVLIAACENDIDDLQWSALELDSDRLPIRSRSRLRFVDRHGRLQYVNQTGVALPRWIERPPAWLQENSYFFNWLRFRVARPWVRLQENRTAAVVSRAAGDPPTGPIAELEPASIDRGLRSGRAFRTRYHAFLFDAIQRLLGEEQIPLRVVAVGPERKGGIANECRAAAPDCLNLSIKLGPEYFFPNDGHWNSAGHQEVARAIADWLRDEPAFDSGTGRGKK